MPRNARPLACTDRPRPIMFETFESLELEKEDVRVPQIYATALARSYQRIQDSL